jgi:VanZ family protein
MRMDRYRVRDLTLFFYCVGILLFIWGNSAVPAAASAEDSGGVRSWLLSLFPDAVEIPFFRFLFDHLRKVMHFTEFFLLAIGTVSFFAHRRQFSLIRLGVMLLSGPAVAFLDEGIQLFSEGRVFSTVDVGIDSLGYFSCILVYMSLALLRRVISRKGDAH